MKFIRNSALFVFLFLSAGCGADSVNEGNADSAWTHVVNAPFATWYRGGPQQASPPDGQVAGGTKVKLIRNSGSYCEIVAESGEVGFVSTDSITEIDP